MLTTFKEKLNVPSQSKTTAFFHQCSFTLSVSNRKCFSIDQSTTPPGSPPADLQKSLGLQSPANSAPAAARNTSSILEALANMARQNTSAPPANPTLPMDSQYNVSNSQSNPAQQVAAFNQGVLFPPIPPPVNVPAAPAFASQGTSNGAQNFASNQTNPFAAVPPIVPPTALDPAVQQQLMLIKALSDQGFPPDKIAGIIAAMGSQGPPMMGAGALPPPPPQFAAQNSNPSAQNGWGTRPEESRDRNGNGYHEAVRSPPGRYRRRSRSRSPPPAWNARDSPASRRRDEPNYDYDRDSPGRNRGDDRGRGRGRGNDYRQRSPPRRGRSPSPPSRANGAGSKWVGHDATIPKGNIKGNGAKLLSHTLRLTPPSAQPNSLRWWCRVSSRLSPAFELC
jgi:protein NRD1